MPASPHHSPKTKSPRKRGAQPGNTNSRHHGAPRGNRNASKYGFYSKWFPTEVHARLDRDRLGQLDDEEFALTTTLDGVIADMQNLELTHDQKAVSARTVGLLVGRIESIHRSRKVVYDQQTTLDKAIEELKYIPADED